MGGVIQLPQRFLTQPQYAAPIDYQGLGKGAAILLNPGVGLRDQSASRDWSLFGNAALRAGQLGKNLYFDGGSSTYAGLTSPDISSAAGTFAVFASRIGVSSTYGHVWLSTSTGNNKYYHIYNSEDRIDWGVGGGSTTISLVGKVFNTVNTSLIFSTNGSGGSGKVFYFNGVATGTPDATAPAVFSAGSNSLVFGKYWGGASWNVDADILVAVYLPGVAWGATEAKAFHDSRGLALFKAPPRRLWLVPSSGVSGSAACVNTDDTSSASGTTTVTGSVAATNANDTSSASGTTTVTGTSSTTNADDSASASGSVGSAVSGSSSTTNADDTASASGTTTVVGSSSAVNTDDSSAATGTTTIVGSASITNANDSVSASGTVTSGSSGTVAYTNNDDVSAVSGTTTVLGSAGQTNNNDTSSASGIINNGIIFESGFNPAGTRRIKKPGVPVGTPDWLKTILEIQLGRRGNAITVPAAQQLTFSSTPTQAECQALYQYVNSVQSALADLINRFDT